MGRTYAHDSGSLGIRTISVSGLHRISENDILARVAAVPGRSILSLDLDLTRESIEKIVWVSHATIQRVWPNEIVVTVVEREPIALARIDSELFQVDTEGVVLDPDALTDATSPILEGLHIGDVAGNKAKIRLYQEIVETIGESELSEVHVAESGDVSIVPSDHPILVNLGLEDYRERWERYLGLSQRIHEDYPDALRIDLRFQDQVVIQTSEDEPSRDIVWGEETRRL